MNKMISNFEGSIVNYINSSVSKSNSSDNDLEHINTRWKIVLGLFFALCILFAVGGNLLVCVAVFSDRRLKKCKNNYFIVSLAVADLLVACVVMSFSMANDILDKWIFGGIFCRIWISFDVMCSTASILNLCVICFDRYKQIKNAMFYFSWMTTRKAVTFIAFVWILSALISFLPIQMGWHLNLHANDTSYNDAECIIKLNFLYAILSSTVSFYAPCLIMLVLYFKLFLVSRSHVTSIRNTARHVTPPGEEKKRTLHGTSFKIDLRSTDYKAAYTLGVITGVFLCCWLPFFIINPISAFNSNINETAFLVSTWLGYVNSCLNPVIYSIFNTEFRQAFKRILSLRPLLERDHYFLNRAQYHMSSNQTQVKDLVITNVNTKGKITFL
ncbi:dopamine receptor 1-like [Physella acuta]|uniref:dopamine receptor 1-like n=1 Tax=Physella acuta TaxID=109671 RepID=UPI0027DD425B|nr:dopamine receptor 1-like [Physella acuta]